MEVYKLEEYEEEHPMLVGVGPPEEAGRTTPEVRAVYRVLNLEKKNSEHLKWTYLEQVQHCTNLPLQVSFPAHTKQGKTVPGLR